MLKFVLKFNLSAQLLAFTLKKMFPGMISDMPHAGKSPSTSSLSLPVSINETGIDVVRSFQASDWLQADACGLIGHDVDQPILELVAGEVGTDEARRMGFGVGQTLEGKDRGKKRMKGGKLGTERV